MTTDGIMFGLAGLGYLTLAKDTALRVAGRRWDFLTATTAGVVGTHVAMIWTVRYGWSISTALENGWAAFLIFHGALALILAAPLCKGAIRDRAVWLAFAIVSTGALPATLRYPEFHVLALPLFGAFAAVLTILVARSRQRQRV